MAWWTEWKEEWGNANFGERIGMLVVQAIVFGLWGAMIIYTIDAYLDAPPLEQKLTIFGVGTVVGLFGIWSVLKQILFVLQGIHRMIYVARSASNG